MVMSWHEWQLFLPMLSMIKHQHKQLQYPRESRLQHKVVLFLVRHSKQSQSLDSLQPLCNILLVKMAKKDSLFMLQPQEMLRWVINWITCLTQTQDTNVVECYWYDKEMSDNCWKAFLLPFSFSLINTQVPPKVVSQRVASQRVVSQKSNAFLSHVIYTISNEISQQI